MRQFKILSILAITCLFAVVGCNTPAVVVAYKAESTAVVTIDTAMLAWGDYVSAHHPGPIHEQKVMDAFNHYKLCALAVVDASKAFAESSSPDDKTKLNAALAAASASLADVLAAVRSFGVKI